MKNTRGILVCLCFLLSLQALAFFNFKSTYKGTKVVQEEKKTEARSPVDVPIPQDECCNKHQQQDSAFGISLSRKSNYSQGMAFPATTRAARII